MHKQLPQPKKSLKSFILEEDAKITDKTAAKITITTAFLAINIAAASQDANAKGHSNHSDHSNNLNVDSDYGTGYHIGNNPSEADINSIQDKSVLSAHGNHYNHTDAGGGQGGFGALVFSIALGAITGGMGLFSMAAEAIGASAIAASSTAFTAAVASSLGVSTFTAGAIIGATTSVGLELITGGGTMGEGVVSSIANIDTGTPHTVPAPIINALREEEQS